MRPEFVVSPITLVHFDHLKNSPRDGIIRQVVKETRFVTQTIRFMSMNWVVICLKSFLKGLAPCAVELAEMFADEATESRI